MENGTNSHVTNLAIEEFIGGTCPFDAWLTSSGTCVGTMFKLKAFIRHLNVLMIYTKWRGKYQN